MLAGAMGALKLGPGIDRSNQVGPMINERSRDDIASMVQDGSRLGRKGVTGASVPERKGSSTSRPCSAGCCRTPRSSSRRSSARWRRW